MFRLLELEAFPETTKESYVQRYGFAERCRHGECRSRARSSTSRPAPRERPSTGSAPARELQDVHLNTANWMRFTFPTERLLAINAFSMGAWATGTNMGIALSKVAMTKSTGPDLEKVVETIEVFGDRIRLPRHRLPAVPQARRRRARRARLRLGAHARVRRRRRRRNDGGDARLPRAAPREGALRATARRTSRSASPARRTSRSGCASCSSSGRTSARRCSAATSAGSRWCSSTTRSRTTSRSTRHGDAVVTLNNGSCSRRSSGTTSATRG